MYQFVPAAGGKFFEVNSGQLVTPEQVAAIQARHPGQVSVGPLPSPVPGVLPQAARMPTGMQASIDPPDYSQWAREGIPFKRRPVLYSTPAIPQDQNIGIFPRKRPIQMILNQAVNTPVTAPLRIDMPFTVYAFSGWATPSDGTALPDNLHPLSTFLIDIRTASNDLYTAEPTLAIDVLGTGSDPAHVGGNGWVLGRGGTINFTVTPLLANLRISITAWGIEFQGPTNIAG